MTNTSCFNHLRRGSAILALAGALAAVAPLTAQTNVAKDQDVGYSRWDISPYVGWQWFQLGQDREIRPLAFDSGFTFGVRVNEDFSRYIGLEESMGMGFNSASFLPNGFPTNARVELGEHNYQVSVVGVLNFTPRGSKIRPFLVVGPGGVWYVPSNGAFQNAGAAVLPIGPFHAKASPALDYGLGIKYSVNKKIALRADLRGMWTEQPHFNIPSFAGPGGIYVPSHGTENALQLTGGVVFTLGYHEPPSPAAPAASSSAASSSADHLHHRCA